MTDGTRTMRDKVVCVCVCPFAHAIKSRTRFGWQVVFVMRSGGMLDPGPRTLAGRTHITAGEIDS